MLARQIVIGVGVALIFPMLVYYGICTLITQPRFQDYHTQVTPPAAAASKEEREAYYSDRRRENQEFQFAQERFAKKMIAVMAPIGIAAILGGYFLGVNAIGTGLLVGGMSCVVYGYAGYWAFLYPWMRFSSLLAGFIVLLLIGAKHAGLTWPPPARKSTPGIAD
jgi:hypothetical protein